MNYFIKDKPHFYFLAKEQNLELEFNRFKQKFSKKYNIYLESKDWEGLFSEPNIYFNIMRAILEGSTKLGEIANNARVDITNMPKYLNRLAKLRMIHKEWPVTSPKEKRALYELTDNYFRFWLTYIFPYQEEIEDSPDQHLDFIKQTYPKYIGRTFERFCMKSLRKIQPGRFNKIGRWWYKDSEIDIVAVNENTKEIWFCECKWQDDINVKKVLNDLKRKAEDVKWRIRDRKEYYAVFSRSFKRKIEENNFVMYDLDDLLSELYGVKT